MSEMKFKSGYYLEEYKGVINYDNQEIQSVTVYKYDNFLESSAELISFEAVRETEHPNIQFYLAEDQDRLRNMVGLKKPFSLIIYKMKTEDNTDKYVHQSCWLQQSTFLDNYILQRTYKHTMNDLFNHITFLVNRLLEIIQCCPGYPTKNTKILKSVLKGSLKKINRTGIYYSGKYLFENIFGDFRKFYDEFHSSNYIVTNDIIQEAVKYFQQREFARNSEKFYKYSKDHSDESLNIFIYDKVRQIMEDLINLALEMSNGTYNTIPTYTITESAPQDILTIKRCLILPLHENILHGEKIITVECFGDVVENKVLDFFFCRKSNSIIISFDQVNNMYTKELSLRLTMQFNSEYHALDISLDESIDEFN